MLCIKYICIHTLFKPRVDELNRIGLVAGRRLCTFCVNNVVTYRQHLKLNYYVAMCCTHSLSILEDRESPSVAPPELSSIYSQRLHRYQIRHCGENAGLQVHFNEGSPFRLWQCMPQGVPQNNAAVEQGSLTSHCGGKSHKLVVRSQQSRRGQ